MARRTWARQGLALFAFAGFLPTNLCYSTEPASGSPSSGKTEEVTMTVVLVADPTPGDVSIRFDGPTIVQAIGSSLPIPEAGLSESIGSRIRAKGRGEPLVITVYIGGLDAERITSLADIASGIATVRSAVRSASIQGHRQIIVQIFSTSMRRQYLHREFPTDPPTAHDSIGAVPPIKAEIPRLIQDLKDADHRVRRRAAERLGWLEFAAGAAVGHLAEALDDPEPEVRSIAARALGFIGVSDKKAVAGLLRALRDKNDFVRVCAAWSLGLIGPAERVVPHLRRALQDQLWEVRRTAAEALGRHGGAAGAAAGDLVEALKDRSDSVISEAEWALAKLGPEAVPHLTQALKDRDKTVRVSAICILRRVGPPASAATVPLLESLKAGDANALLIGYALGCMGSKAVPHLVRALKDDSPHVRKYVASALGDIGAPAKAAIPNLVHNLKDKDPSVRSTTASVLGEFGCAAKEAVPLLTAALEDPEHDVRLCAAYALGAIGVTAPKAVSSLIRNLQDKHASVRLGSIGALGRIGPPEKVVPHLIRALGDEHWEVREEAGEALARIGPRATRACPALMAALKDKDRAVQRSAAHALGLIGPAAKAAIPHLLDPSKSEDRRMSLAAKVAVARIKQEVDRAIPDLIKALDGTERPPDSDLAYDAVRSLEEIGPPAKASVPTLIAVLRRSEWYVRRRAVWALARIDPARRETVAALAEASTVDDSEEVRKAAAAVLRHIQPTSRPATSSRPGQKR